MPADFVEYGKSWERCHPKWTVHLWDDRWVDQFQHNVVGWTPLNAPKLFERATSPSQCKDLLAPEILFRFGGVYIDCDFECRRPIDELLEGVDAFAASEAQGVISSGIMGCVPGHSSFRGLAAAARRVVRTRQVPSNETGPKLATRHLRNVKVFPSELFYPYLYNEPERATEEFPEAFAVHHWAASWIA